MAHMKSLRVIISVLFLSGVLGGVVPVYSQDSAGIRAQLPPDEYYRAKVIRVVEKGDSQALGISNIVEQVRILILSGREKGIEVTAQNTILSNDEGGFPLKARDVVVGVKSYGIDGVSYAVTDHFRLIPLFGIFLFFVALVALFGRLRGVMSVVGLLVSIVIITGFIVPQIAAGRDPVLISIIGSVGILLISMYLAHGFCVQTTVSLASTIVTLGVSALLASRFVQAGKFFGSGTEDALYLQLSTGTINLQGLLLGGIIIGTLGVLDDITTVQTATIAELKRANRAFSFADLYRRGIVIGREHIASLVNTLALAYTGASLPLLLLFTLQNNQPLWMVFNSEMITEEILRTLVGSVALILAVPISTIAAAVFFSRR